MIGTFGDLPLGRKCSTFQSKPAEAFISQ